MIPKKMKSTSTSSDKTNLNDDSGLDDTDFETDNQGEEFENLTHNREIEHDSRHEGKKKPRYTSIVDIVHNFQYYAKLGAKRKINYFKIRKVNPLELKYDKPTKQGKKRTKKNDELHRAEIEMETIANLREMYFTRPKILKAIEEIKTEKELKAKKRQSTKTGANEIIPPTNVCRLYLDKYKQEKLDELFLKMPRTGRSKSKQPKYNKEDAQMNKSRDAIRNGYVVSVFNIDDDNLFTNNELLKIHQMKKDVSLFNKRRDIKEVMQSREVWEWDQLVKSFPHFSKSKDAPKISDVIFVAKEDDDDRILNPKPEQRIKHYLENWFQRESPREESELFTFQYYRKRYQIRKYAFSNAKCRLDAAIKFVKLAKVVYPDLDCMKVLKELECYIGPITLDELQAHDKQKSSNMGSFLKRPKEKLRYFRKLLKETKELEKMLEPEEIKKLNDGRIKMDIHKEEEKLKSTLENNNMSNIYDNYVESCLPSPFNETFISIANSLIKFKIYIGSHPKSKAYKKEIGKLVAKILRLVLESMKWLIDTIFRTSNFFYFSEDKETYKEETTDEAEEDRTFNKLPDPTDQVIKKLIANIIKLRNFKCLFQKKDPDISSVEFQSLPSINIRRIRI